jgi:hypothetical protein
MFSSLVRRFAPAGIVILFLILGLPRELSSAPAAGNTSPAWNGLAPLPPMGYNNWSRLTTVGWRRTAPPTECWLAIRRNFLTAWRGWETRFADSV